MFIEVLCGLSRVSSLNYLQGIPFIHDMTVNCFTSGWYLPSNTKRSYSGSSIYMNASNTVQACMVPGQLQ